MPAFIYHNGRRNVVAKRNVLRETPIKGCPLNFSSLVRSVVSKPQKRGLYTKFIHMEWKGRNYCGNVTGDVTTR
jgi:hypothetical protein